MSIVNATLARLVDGLLYPFQHQPPLVGLLVASLLTAVAMLAVVRATSDQRRLNAVKRSIQACLFEIRLFNDDARAMWRAVAEIFRHNLAYLRLSMAPLLWMAIPLGLLLAQLQSHYGYRGLDVGQQTLVTVRLKDAPAADPVLTAPRGIRIETPAVRIPALGEAAWRIVADEPGDYELALSISGRTFTKTVRVSNAIVRRSPVRPDPGFLSQLRHPAEPPLPADSAVESIAVTYPRRDIGVLGARAHWLIVFFVLSTIFAFALRRRFGVVL
jgi:uncharacterized membrane protein (DUF106 family)